MVIERRGANVEIGRVGAGQNSAVLGIRGTASGTDFRSILERSLHRWEVLEKGIGRQEAQAPKEFRALLGLQRQVQVCSVELHLYSSAAESVNQTVRKLQQMGGS